MGGCTDQSSPIGPEGVRNYQITFRLANGCLLQIRSIRPDDKAALAEAFRKLSRDSVHSRFLAYKKDLTDTELQYLTEVDSVRHVSLVAVFPELDPAKIVGIGRYILINQDPANLMAEFALVVVDEYQAMGIGTALLRHLANIARKAGVRTFEAFILRENMHIRELFEHCGFQIHGEANGELLKMILNIDTDQPQG